MNLTHITATAEAMAKAALYRLFDRPRCANVEIAIIAAPSRQAPEMAVELRRAGISAEIYPDPKRAKRDDPDFLLFVDTLKLRCAVTRAERVLLRDALVRDAMNAVNEAYLPIDWDKSEGVTL